MGWIAKNYYLSYAEMENNAEIIYRYFRNKGWSINAIAALLGNMEVESNINPGIWENLTTDPEAFREENGYLPGFGLVQWTPYTKFANWAGELWRTNYWKQLERIVWEVANDEQYEPTSAYPETFREFTTSDKSAYYLAGAFLYNYERPANPDAHDRGLRADRWLQFLRTLSSVSQLNIPAWLLFKLRK